MIFNCFIWLRPGWPKRQRHNTDIFSGLTLLQASSTEKLLLSFVQCQSVLPSCLTIPQSGNCEFEVHMSHFWLAFADRQNQYASMHFSCQQERVNLASFAGKSWRSRVFDKPLGYRRWSTVCQSRRTRAQCRFTALNGLDAGGGFRKQKQREVRGRCTRGGLSNYVTASLHTHSQRQTQWRAKRLAVCVCMV